MNWIGVLFTISGGLFIYSVAAACRRDTYRQSLTVPTVTFAISVLCLALAIGLLK